MFESESGKATGKRMVILMGIQGSGKSTFYSEYLSENYIRVNLDTLKTRNNEQYLIAECIEQGKNLAIDNTNPTVADRKKYIDIAKAAGYEVHGYFMESKLKECIERNNKRTGKACVPPKAIAATSNKLQIPDYAEGFDKLFFVANDGKQMKISEWRRKNEV